MVVREGSNVSLRCEATGSPTPNITWRREDGELIILGKSQGKNKQEGKLLASQPREREREREGLRQLARAVVITNYVTSRYVTVDY